MTRNPKEAFDNAFAEAGLTHPSWEARTSAALVACVVAHLVEGGSPAEAVESTYCRTEDDEAGRNARCVFAPLSEYHHDPGGWTVYTTRLALRCLLDAEDFRSGVERVVRLAGDADTNGAVAGALLGAHFGASDIPSGWLEALFRKDDLLDPL